MKVSKVLIVAVLVTGLVMTFNMVHAKMGGPGKGYKMTDAERTEKHQTRIKNLTKKLDLTAEQQQQLTAILDAQRDKMASLRKQMMQLKEQMKAIRTEQQSKIKAMLTPEQLKKYEEKPNKNGNKQGKKNQKKWHKKNKGMQNCPQ